MTVTPCRECEAPLPSFSRFCPMCSEAAPVRRSDRCGSCGEGFGHAFAHCPGCGAARTNASRQVPPDVTAVCARCQGPTHVLFGHCPSCGALKDDVRELCPDCDHRVEGGWLYCVRCGSRIEHLFNLQERGFSCGAAALRNALAMLGISKPEPELRELTGARPFHGTDDEGFAKAAARLGLSHEHIPRGDLARLRSEVGAGNPCVVDWRHGQHYVCVIAATEARIVFVDSNPRDAGMVRALAPDRFSQLWWDSDDASTRQHAMHVFRMQAGELQAARRPA